MGTSTDKNLKNKSNLYAGIEYITIAGILITNILLRLSSAKDTLSNIDIILGIAVSIIVSRYINYKLFNKFKSKYKQPKDATINKVTRNYSIMVTIVAAAIDLILNRMLNYQFSITIQISIWGIASYIILSSFYKRLQVYNKDTEELSISNHTRVYNINTSGELDVNESNIKPIDSLNENKPIQQTNTVSRKRDLKSLGEKIEKDKKTLDLKTEYSIKMTKIDWKSIYNWEKLDYNIAELGPVILRTEDNYVILKPIQIPEGESLVNYIDELVKNNLNNLGNEYYYKTESQLNLAINKCVLTKNCLKIVNTIDEIETKINIESLISSTELQLIKDSLNIYLQGLDRFKRYYIKRLDKLQELKNQEKSEELSIIEKELILNINILTKLLDDSVLANNCMELKKCIDEYKTKIHSL